jgi:hypothetical protein
MDRINQHGDRGLRERWGMFPDGLLPVATSERSLLDLALLLLALAV